MLLYYLSVGSQKAQTDPIQTPALGLAHCVA